MSTAERTERMLGLGEERMAEVSSPAELAARAIKEHLMAQRISVEAFCETRLDKEEKWNFCGIKMWRATHGLALHCNASSYQLHLQAANTSLFEQL